MMKWRSTSLVVMLFVAGCSGGGSMSPPAGGATPIADALEESPTKTVELEEAADGSGRAELGAKSPKPTTGRRDPADAGSGKREAAAGGGDGLVSMPAQGGYVYAQSGWEELCQTGTCDRSELPSRQDQRVTHLQRSRVGGRFEMETRGSGSRSQTLVYLVERDRVSVEEIRSVFSTGGLSFETTIVPDPPILSLKLPVQVGEKWSGGWTDRRDDVDGTYRFAVVRREGGSIVLDSRLEFRGEFQGFNDLRLWIDPDHLTITATTGKVEIRSTYGTYRSEFATSLVSKP